MFMKGLLKERRQEVPGKSFSNVLSYIVAVYFRGTGGRDKTNTLQTRQCKVEKYSVIDGEDLNSIPVSNQRELYSKPK